MKGFDTQAITCGVCVEPSHFLGKERTMPTEALEGHALVDIAANGICATHFDSDKGKHPFLARPRLIEHGLSGRLASGPDAGQLVVIGPSVWCGTCRACRHGKLNCCADRIAGRVSPRQHVRLHRRDQGRRLSGRESQFAAGRHGRVAGADVRLIDLKAARLETARRRFGFENAHAPGDEILAGAPDEGSAFDATENRPGDRGRLSAAGAWCDGRAGQRGQGRRQVLGPRVPQARGPGHRQPQRARNRLRLRHGGNAERQHPTEAISSDLLPLKALPDRSPDLVAYRDDVIKIIVTP